jgi:hypothetical protein
MKFKSTRELETELRKVTSLKTLQEDITLISLGETIVVKPLGVGMSGGQKEIAYLGENNATSLKVTFTGEGDAVTVTEVKLTKR